MTAQAKNGAWPRLNAAEMPDVLAGCYSCSVFVTAGTPSYVDLAREVADALRALNLDVREVDGALTVDGRRVALDLLERAHPTPAEVRDLIDKLRSDNPVVVVADRISEPGREELRDSGWGWLDRRGHLRVWTPGVRIEGPIPARDQDPHPTSTNAWTTVGLEIALAALIEPTRAVTARSIAPLIGRSVGAVHQIIGRFNHIGLIGSATNRPLLPDLFWETSAHWPEEGWMALPIDLEELSGVVTAEALVRVDERAATLGGARIPAAGDLPARVYITASGVLRRARRLADPQLPARSWIREAPIDWVPTHSDYPPNDDHPWLIAHPMICALRLARDRARGREIVADWGIVPGGPDRPDEPDGPGGPDELVEPGGPTEGVSA